MSHNFMLIQRQLKCQEQKNHDLKVIYVEIVRIDIIRL